jgi:hypothetical protein
VLTICVLVLPLSAISYQRHLLPESRTLCAFMGRRAMAFTGRLLSVSQDAKAERRQREVTGDVWRVASYGRRTDFSRRRRLQRLKRTRRQPPHLQKPRVSSREDPSDRRGGWGGGVGRLRAGRRARWRTRRLEARLAVGSLKALKTKKRRAAKTANTGMLRKLPFRSARAAEPRWTVLAKARLVAAATYLRFEDSAR